jgi:hypothetical protein
MHASEKSDPAIVAMKPPNKAGSPAEEVVERRAGTKGNADQQSTHRTQTRERVTQALNRVRQAARQRKKERFSFPDYLTQLGPSAQEEIFKRSSVDLAMRDAYRKIRDFLMHAQNLSEDEAISLISVAVDFGVTQVVDGNWGMHASIKKALFAGTTA